MIKEIKAEKFEGLAVLVPTEIESFQIQYFSMAGTWLTESNSKNLNAWKVSLPFKNKQGKIKYEIIGKATELTRQQCADVVKYVGLPWNAYKDYTSNSNWFNNPTQSFKSLLDALTCYSENPYGNLTLKDEDAGSELEMEVYPKWKRAEVNTGTWLILKKLIN